MNAALQEAVERCPAYGFSKLFKVLRRLGHSWNHKCVLPVETGQAATRQEAAAESAPGTTGDRDRSEPDSTPGHPGTGADRGLACYPNKLRMDNGPELVSTTLAEWAQDHDIELEFIQPGKPTQNSCVECSNRTCRDEALNMCLFRTLHEDREITENWIRQYNEERPHDSLDDLVPLEYLATRNPLENSDVSACWRPDIPTGSSRFSIARQRVS